MIGQVQVIELSDPEASAAALEDGLEELTAFVDRLEGQVAAMPGRTVKSRVIGDLILDFLRGLDAVAYVRYASVYRSFNSVDEFMSELKKLQDQGTIAAPTPETPQA